MRGMLLKELYQHRLGLIAVTAILLAVMCMNRILYLFAEPFAALAIAMYPVFSLHADAVSRFDRWHVILPAERRCYADVYYLMLAVMTVLLLTVHTLTWFYLGLDEGFTAIAAGLTVLCLLAPAVYLPVTFRFGITAGRLTAIVMILPYVLLGITLTDITGSFGSWERGTIALLSGGAVSAAVPVLLFVLSWMRSAALLKAKEY